VAASRPSRSATYMLSAMIILMMVLMAVRPSQIISAGGGAYTPPTGPHQMAMNPM